MRLFLNIKISKLKIYFNLSKSTLYRWIQEGEHKPIRTKRTTKLLDLKQNLIDFILINNTFTLKDIQTHIFKEYNITVSITTIQRFCKYNNITHKKGSYYYIESNKLLVNNFLEYLKNTNLEKYIILDEASFVLNHTKSYGRSLKNTRTIINKPGRRLERYSLLLTIGYNNYINWQLHKGSINSVKFQSFVNTLPYDTTLILDNARIHHATKSLTKLNLPTIKETSDTKRITLKYLPPYTPTLNPVEYCFNIIRSYVNKEGPRTYDSLLNSITRSVKLLIPNKIICKVWNS